MKRGRTLSYYQEHPRAFDEAVFDWNDRELARHGREMDREPDVDEDYEAWLEQIDPEDAA
jgi:hypothetical protein